MFMARVFLISFILTLTFSSRLHAAELKILVVISKNVEAIYDGNNEFAKLRKIIGDAFEGAGQVRPNIVLSVKRPQFAEHFSKKNQALGLAFLPEVA